MADRPLVLVSVGTDCHQFDRLVAWADSWAEAHPRIRVLVQHGSSRPPETAEAAAYLDRDQLQQAMERAALIVCHGGPATITEARRSGHLPIVVPRDPAQGEHVDDHQLRFAARLDTGGLIRACATRQQLAETLDKAIAQPIDFRLDREEEAPASAALRAGALIDLLARPSSTESTESTEAGPAAGEAVWDWPEVAVVVPTRDRPDLLRRTLRSIAAQDYPGRIRTLVVYDRSEPDRSLADGEEDRPLQVLQNSQTPGLAGARNTGVMAAGTAYVAFCDDDDIWLPHKLRTQMEVMRDHPGTGLVCCGIRVSYEGAEVERVLSATHVHFADLLRSRLTELHPSTFLFRREFLVDGCGLVSEQIPGSYAEDYELLLRVARDGTVRNIPDAAVRVLWHRRSHFAERWGTISLALRWLLAQYPEFRLVKAGYARVAGQVAFAEAAAGRRLTGLRWAAATLRSRPTEPRAYLATAVAAGLPPGAVLRTLHRYGKGI